MDRTEYLEARAIERRQLGNKAALGVLWLLACLIAVNGVAKVTATACVKDPALCEKLAK